MMAVICIAACSNEVARDAGRGDSGGVGGSEAGGEGGERPERLPAVVAFENVEEIGSDGVEGVAIAYFDARLVDDPCTRQDVGVCRYARCPGGYSSRGVPSADAGDLSVTTPVPIADYGVARDEGYLFWSPDRGNLREW